MRALAAAAALALAVPGAVRAQPVSYPAGRGPDTFVEVRVGAFLPQSDELDVLDPGYAFGAAFGARFSRYLGVEGELGYLRATGESRGLETTFADFPVAASLRARAPIGPVELSLLGGASLDVAFLSQELDLGGTVTRASDTSVAFGFHAAAQLAFQLSPTMLVGAEARRTFLEPRFDGARVKADGLRLAITLTYHL